MIIIEIGKWECFVILFIWKVYLVIKFSYSISIGLFLLINIERLRLFFRNCYELFLFKILDKFYWGKLIGK